MPRKPDALDNLTPEGQAAVLRLILTDMFGEERAGPMLKQIEAAMRMKARQIGDAPEPEKNFWKGAFRIHEIE